ncbi:FAD-dependent monooxygenase [Umezawaea sp. Da 62-37]|uniref:FAD-dependent monooxygenase n=1 Tax=Umezawaea sp. Da 62-37 TaxID=3075927 RepID=UPI0028F73004|nr:FAD-dependent monooxygenase [Umezawaea sp. Da 62-37]WNV84420.1 FAD-dependent monooxygenase [Umezawaea sp. Da 62-37]
MEQVVVVGGGPVGLWLAAELGLGGVPVTVLETRTERDPHSKALTIHPRTLEVLAFRGVVDRFLAEGMRIPNGHFGGLDDRMDFRVLDTDFPFTLALPQVRTEELLEEHAVERGARILRGHRVTGLRQDADSVALRVTGPDGPYELTAAYVVGCDGTRSAVREAAGIDFPGTPDTTWGWLADVVLDDPPPSLISISGANGGLMAVPMPGGVHRFVGGSSYTERPGELTLDEVRATVTAIAGTDFGLRDPRWLSRFGNATRQAERYRDGRVLLAGDAAHMHFPAGGVGLNVGVQDATNLGWKLAATALGTAPDGLLDSYHDERHPVGADLLLSTRAQTALMNAATPEVLALRALLSGCIATVPEFSRTLAERLSGLAVAYRPGDHPLVGTRAPDLRVAGTSLFTLLRTGKHVPLDFTGEPAEHAGWEDVRGALIRPDGHVAWASGKTATATH